MIILQGFIGFCFGALAASGVLTVLTAVGLTPRYAGRVHEAKHIVLFENMMILGTMSGTAVTLFADMWQTGGLGQWQEIAQIGGGLLRILYGVFSGIFVGTLALAIAEMLDSIPIYFRRVKLGGGLRIILLAVALGKMAGAFLYFYLGLYASTTG